VAGHGQPAGTNPKETTIMSKFRATLAITAITLAMPVVAITTVAGYGQAAPTPALVPVTCTFDGGGTIAAGTYATTTEGTTWACNPAGTLVRITLTPPAAPAGTMPVSAYVR
jgi:hypothetical protein